TRRGPACMRRSCSREPSRSAISCERSADAGSSAAMLVQRYADARAFNDRIAPALEPAERENNLLLGAVRRLAHTPGHAAFMAAVSEDDHVVCATLLEPPFNLLVSPAPGGAFEALGERLLEWRITIPGVMALEQVADAFATLWQRLTRCGAARGTDVRLLALGPTPQVTATPGVLRAAGPLDIPLLALWSGAFFPEVGLPNTERDLFIARLEEEAAARRLWLWESDGQPVSMLGYRETTTRTVRIG